MTTQKRMLFSFIGAAAITVLYFLWAYETIPFVYDIIDDIMMRDAAAGVTTGTPDGHLIYVKYLLGLAISSLYKYIPGFDWYGIAMLIFCCTALLIVLYRGLVMKRNLLFKLGYLFITLLIFTCIALRHLCAFQFTVSAGLIGGAGLFLFLTCSSEDKTQLLIEEGASVLCLLCALCIRDTVFLLMLPAAALIFWYKYSYFVKGKFPFRLKHWKLPAALLCGCICILGVEAFAYRSPEWRTYLRYNSSQVHVMDYYGMPSYEENMPFYEKLNISHETAVNIGRYSLHLATDVYPEHMESISEKAKEIYFEEYSFLERFGVGLTKLYNSMKKKDVLLTVAIVLIVFAITWSESRSDSKKQLFLGLLNLIFLACWLYLSYRARIVDRVTYTLLFIQLFIYLGMLTVFSEQPETDRTVSLLCQNLCIFFCAGVLLCGLAHMQVTELRENNHQRQVFNQQFLELKKYMAKQEDHAYFVTTYSIDQSSDIFTLHRDLEFSNMMEIGSWASFSALDTQKLKKLGVKEQNMEQAILRNKDCYVVSSVSVDYMDRYFSWKYGEAYGGKTLVDRQNYGGADFFIYKFTLKE